MKRSLTRLLTAVLLFLPFAANAAQEPKALPQLDERFKTDILVVVAHPDDEGAATPYLARALDEGKRVAVVYGTHGSSGGNEVGAEQAAALGEIREIEARRALSVLGITNAWFLGGKDTASQNMLQSLANWDHGASLEQLVRLVRLTRPEVILTFLPGTFIGEDHGDHQAAGVLATEAFDLAGDPVAFPEQVSVPTKRLEPFLENLRPWQPKKIYYFPDADNEDMFKGSGPVYSVKDISRLAKRPYWHVALDSFLQHQTQSKGFGDTVAKMTDVEIEKMATNGDFWGNGLHFVRGKSLVGGSVTGDIFEGINPGAISFSRPEIVPEISRPELTVELAGPWSFYASFRNAHGLTHLAHPEPPEIALQLGTTLAIPLWLRNQSAAAQIIMLSVDLPAGWTLQSGAGKFSIAPMQVASARIEVSLPPLAADSPTKLPIQEITIRADSEGKSIGVVKMRVEPRKRTLPE